METTDYKRFLKYRLHPADVLFFRCIPGNGCEWLFPVLEAHFPEEEIFPPYTADSETAFTRYSDEARSRFRLIRGDLEYGTGDRAVYRYLSRNPIKITWLRHPVGRALELYHQALTRGRVPGKTSLEGYVLSAEGRRDLCNAQARAIVGETVRATPGDETLGYSMQAFQKLAEDNLEQMHFIGLAEEAERSAQLLSYTFDWELVGWKPSEVAFPREIDRDVHTAIMSQAEYDLDFYEYARALFDRRHRQMVGELLDFEASRRAEPNLLPETTPSTGLAARALGAVRRRLPGYRARGRARRRRERAQSSSEE